MAFIIWLKFFPETGVFRVSFKPVAWSWQGILLTPLAFIVGSAFGMFFLKMAKLGARLGGMIKNNLVKGVLGGMILCAFALCSSYFLWSGAFTLWKMVGEAAVLGPVMLIILAVGKAVLTNVTFGLGLRGGTIFPAIFSSVALGLAFALLLPWSQNLLVVVITAASVSMIVGRPKLVALLLIFLFTLRLAPVIVIVCWLSEQCLNSNWLLEKMK